MNNIFNELTLFIVSWSAFLFAILYVAKVKSEEATKKARKLERIRILVQPILNKATPLQKAALVNNKRWELYRGPRASGKTTYLLLDYFKHMIEVDGRYDGVLIVNTPCGIRNLMNSVVQHYPYKLGLKCYYASKMVVFRSGYGSRLRFVTPAELPYKCAGMDLAWFGMDPDGNDIYNPINMNDSWFRVWQNVKEYVAHYSYMSYLRHGKQNPYGRVRLAKYQHRSCVYRDIEYLYQFYVGQYKDRGLINV